MNNMDMRTLVAIVSLLITFVGGVITVKSDIATAKVDIETVRDDVADIRKTQLAGSARIERLYDLIIDRQVSRVFP